MYTIGIVIMCFYGWYVSNHIKDMLNGPAIIKCDDIKPTRLEKRGTCADLEMHGAAQAYKCNWVSS